LPVRSAPSGLKVSIKEVLSGINDFPLGSLKKKGSLLGTQRLSSEDCSLSLGDSYKNISIENEKAAAGIKSKLETY
jgi:hypothetical protein